MKKSEMILKMQKVYGIRFCMVEGGYITLNQFMEELLEVMEDSGMTPPLTELNHIKGFKDNAWDPE